MKNQNKNQVFNKKQYLESYQRTNNIIKKNFEIQLEILEQQNHNVAFCDFSSDSYDEEIFQDNQNIRAYINGEYIDLPLNILELQNLNNIITIDQYEKLLDESDKKHLQTLLPDFKQKSKKENDNLQNQTLDKLFKGDVFNFSNPMDEFLYQLKTGCFTKLNLKEKNLSKSLYDQEIFKHLNKSKDQLEYKTIKFQDQQNSLFFQKRKNMKQIEDMFSSASDKSLASIEDISLENSLQDISGYSSEDLTLNNNLGNSKSKVNLDLLSNSSQPQNDLDIMLSENRKLEAQKASFLESIKIKKVNLNPMDDNISQGSNPNKISKVYKNAPTIKTGSKEWIDKFYIQEMDRYKNPTKPWIYQCQDGSQAIVAPVAKRITSSMNSKPREHILLKTERPAFITILCLVRDAAARLPNGVGTRADICELLKESQYINTEVSDDKLSNIVSGALDRLHYEDDPCVKYYSDQKLWVYLHKDRTLDYSGWQDNGENRSSKKKEYNQKYVNKKRIKIQEMNGTSINVND